MGALRELNFHPLLSMSIAKAFNGRVTCHKQMISTEINVERIVEENIIQHQRYIAVNENNLQSCNFSLNRRHLFG